MTTYRNVCPQCGAPVTRTIGADGAVAKGCDRCGWVAHYDTWLRRQASGKRTSRYARKGWSRGWTPG